MKTLLVAIFLAAFALISISPAQAGLSIKGKRATASEGQNSFTDTIKKLRDDDEGLVVLFSKNTGSYYLRRDVADFEGQKKKLEEAFKAKKPVSVTFDADQLNILEVK